jgi:hypothetical protein
MRDSKPPPPPPLHPTYKKQRDALLMGYDCLDEEDRETVRLSTKSWGFMASTMRRQWVIWDGTLKEPRILGA